MRSMRRLSYAIRSLQKNWTKDDSEMSMNVLSSEKSSHRNIQLESIFRNNGDLLRSMVPEPDHRFDPVSSLSPLSVSADKLNSERKGKKHYDAAKNGATLMNDRLYSPTLITISEAKSRSTSSSSSAKTSSPCTRSGDEKAGDTSANDSRGSCLDTAVNAPIKRHTGTDSRWEAIQLISSRDPPISLRHFKVIKRLGYGDIGSVYLVELKGTGTIYAMKMMDKASLVSRNKLLRAQTEREILSLLDHPFLPTLYAHFETEKFNCLVMEYCSGGNLHTLRQKQTNRHFCEKAARFYASEVLLSIEYLHMLGIVYRDLKPENVLVRENGHIMLSDFDLSLQCSVKPRLLLSSSPVHEGSSGRSHGPRDIENVVQGCMQPKAFFPRILPKKNHKHKPELGFAHGALPELMAEPTSARSMSFVGTHEYLAPEIIRGEGHGSAVDWWTFGVFLYELLYGTTPFKGSGNRATLFNVVGQPLVFPEMPNVSATARELIRGLLVKEPQKRIGYCRGATEIKQHPFFDGVNWALVRSAAPPHVPETVDVQQRVLKELCRAGKKVAENGGNGKRNLSSHQNFEYF